MDTPIWTPARERVESSNLYAFLNRMKARHDFQGEDYAALHRWSVEQADTFWEEVWRDAEVAVSAPHTAVLTDRSMPVERTLPREVWFPGVRFNIAQHLLRFRDDRPALIAESEGGEPRTLTYRELYAQVARCQAGLKALGVEAGDRVAGFLPNTVEPIVAMLATAATGGVWSSTSPDFGFQGVLDRFGQINPTVLICADGYCYNGKVHDTLEKAAQLAREIPS
ncbi:MAG: AMP-binding protein, partial [SAR324 cluster bacterium]|nr:AMP-binding protein [SAR324 cluster bacterium]